MRRSLLASSCIASAVLFAPDMGGSGGGASTNLFGEADTPPVDPRDEFVILGGELIAEHLQPLRMRAEQTFDQGLTVTANTVERCCQSLLRHIVGLIPSDMVAGAVMDIRRAKDQQALDQEDQNTLHPADGTIHPDGTTVDPDTGALIPPTGDEPTATDVKAAQDFTPSTAQPVSDEDQAAVQAEQDKADTQAEREAAAAQVEADAKDEAERKAAAAQVEADAKDEAEKAATAAAQEEADAKARADLLAGGVKEG